MTQHAMNAITESAAPVTPRNRTGFSATPLGSAALKAATEGWTLILQTPEAGAGRHGEAAAPKPSPATCSPLG